MSVWRFAGCWATARLTALPCGVLKSRLPMWKLVLVPTFALILLCSSAITVAKFIGSSSPSLEIAYIAYNGFISRLHIIDVEHRLSYRVSAAPVTNADFAWSPDGNQLAFISYIGDSTEVFVAASDGSWLRQLTVGVQQEYYLAWSPDNQHIVFSRQQTDDITFPELFIMNVDNRDERLLTHDQEVEARPVWSPDGTQIAYILYVDSLNVIRIVDAQSGTLLGGVNEVAGNFDHLSWSPDGTRLAFTVYNGPGVIYVMEISTKQIFALTVPTQSNYLPAWSPDGRQIVFISERDLNAEIYVMDANGENQRRLTYTPNAIEGFPSWSPDGTQIAFTATDSSGGDIYVINTDGGNLHRITSDPALNEWLPRWRP